MRQWEREAGPIGSQAEKRKGCACCLAEWAAALGWWLQVRRQAKRPKSEREKLFSFSFLQKLNFSNPF
jgi:hypothetical protein